MSKFDNTTTFLCGLSRNSGSLPEPSGLVQTCIEIAIIFYSSSKKKTHTHTHATHNIHMTEIQCKPNNHLCPMCQLCVTKGKRNIRIGGMLDTVILVCTLEQGVRADVARFPLLAIYILFICIKHKSKWTTFSGPWIHRFPRENERFNESVFFPVATFVHITTW